MPRLKFFNMTNINASSRRYKLMFEIPHYDKDARTNAKTKVLQHDKYQCKMRVAVATN
jgi:hypothetical protein